MEDQASVGGEPTAPHASYAVSYTHLIPGAPLFTTRRISGVERSDDIVFAVSYTHLDVYKRQVRDHSNRRPVCKVIYDTLD